LLLLQFNVPNGLSTVPILSLDKELTEKAGVEKKKKKPETKGKK